LILHATEQGVGPPLVLLHGLFGRSQNFGALARRLAANHRVISLDLRNHGASPHASGMDYGTMAEDVRETLSGLGAWPACILGHSMGGKTAMMLALRYPAQVRSLIVGDIAPVAYRHGNTRIGEAMAAIPLAPGLTRAAADAALAASVPQKAVRGFLLQNLVFAETPYWRIGLLEITAALGDIEGWPGAAGGVQYTGPAWFITGAQSDYVLAEHRPVIERLFPACRILAISDAGHWLHADQPEAFTAIVEQALEPARATGI
jgi:pimeloyl-ACP methyl ester carboxylesterase